MNIDLFSLHFAASDSIFIDFFGLPLIFAYLFPQRDTNGVPPVLRPLNLDDFIQSKAKVNLLFSKLIFKDQPIILF